MQLTAEQTMATKLSPEVREKLIETLAERYLENMSLKDLELFFYDTQTECLRDYTDEEILGEAQELIYSEELSDILQENPV